MRIVESRPAYLFSANEALRQFFLSKAEHKAIQLSFVNAGGIVPRGKGSRMKHVVGSYDIKARERRNNGRKAST